MKTTPSNPSSGSAHQTANLANRLHGSALLTAISCLLGSLTLHADDSFATAIAIQPGEVSGAISPVDDVDYFKFTITSAQRVSIATIAGAIGLPPTAISLRLYDSSGSHISDGNSRYSTQTASVDEFLQAGTYYVIVYCTGTVTGNYRLVMKNQSGATPIGQIVQGNLDVPHDFEVYQFTVNSPGYVKLQARKPSISVPALYLGMNVRDEAGNSLFSRGSVGMDASFSGIFDPGNYFVTVASGSSGDFSLKLTTPDNAVAIADGTTRGKINVPLDHDYYRFVISGKSQRSVRLRTSGSVYLLPDLQNQFGQSLLSFSSSQTHDQEITLDPGVYYVMVSGYYTSGAGSYGDYNLSLSGIIPKVSEISVSEQNGREMTDGKSEVRFGTAVVKAKKAITKTFVIKNTGTGTLTGIKVTRRGTYAANFKIKSQPASSLSAGKKTKFKVVFEPKAKGGKRASLRIASNDADESPFDILLTGKVVKKSRTKKSQ